MDTQTEGGKYSPGCEDYGEGWGESRRKLMLRLTENVSLQSGEPNKDVHGIGGSGGLNLSSPSQGDLCLLMVLGDKDQPPG